MLFVLGLLGVVVAILAIYNALHPTTPSFVYTSTTPNGSKSDSSPSVLYVPQQTAVSPSQPRSTPETISPELDLWYKQLQAERAKLNTNDAKAVAVFNEQVADYKQALEEARAKIR